MANQELPESLNVVAEFMSDRLISHGINPQSAVKMAIDCCWALMAAVGGREVYIPKGISINYTKRDLQIYNELRDSVSVKELSEKYGITERRIFQIAAAVRNGKEMPEQYEFKY